MINEPKIGQKIYLSARSLHGKKTIIENGQNWIVIDIKEKVMCCGFKKAMCLESVLTKNWRWVRIESDKDYYWNISEK